MTAALSGILGTLGAMVAYFFPGQGIPMLLKGYEGNAVIQTSLQQLGLPRFFLVMLIVVLTGLVSSAWGCRQVKD